MFLQILIISITALSVLYLWWINQFQYWKKRGVPFIKPAFPFGTIRTYGKMYGAYRSQMQYNEMKGKGPFCGTYLYFMPAALAVDISFVKRVLVKDFDHFPDHGLYYNEKHDPLSAHLMTLDGPKWRELRHKFTPTFTSSKMKYMFPTMIGITEKLIEVLGKENPEKIEIKEMLAKFTTDVIGSCAFGLKCNSLENPNSTFRKMGKLAIENPKYNRLIQIFTMIAKPLAKSIGIKVIRDDVSKFFMGAVKDTVKYREENQVTRNDFMDILLKLKNKDNTLSINELAAQCFVFFIAGFETSSSAMSHALFELAQNQEAQDKARNAVEEALNRHDGEFNFEAINDMKYIDYCIQESLRKYPVKPMLTRKVVKDYYVPEYDVTLKKGTMVTIPVWAIHRDPEFYPDPEVYIPERFEPEEVAKRPQCSFLAFGEGPRICIGLRFGMMQARIGLAMILKNFKITLHKETKVPIEFKGSHSFLLCSNGGFYLNLEKIN